MDRRSFIGTFSSFIAAIPMVDNVFSPGGYDKLKDGLSKTDSHGSSSHFLSEDNRHKLDYALIAATVNSIVDKSDLILTRFNMGNALWHPLYGGGDTEIKSCGTATWVNLDLISASMDINRELAHQFARQLINFMEVKRMVNGRVKLVVLNKTCFVEPDRDIKNHRNIITCSQRYIIDTTANVRPGKAYMHSQTWMDLNSYGIHFSVTGELMGDAKTYRKLPIVLQDSLPVGEIFT
jgi:hypothetical protein